MKKTPAPKVAAPSSKKSTTSEIDLSQLPISELRKLKEQLDTLLSPDVGTLRDTDIVLTYDVQIRTAHGIFSRNQGSTRLNALTNLRLLADAPNRFEHEFMQQVYAPVSAEVYDLIEQANPTPYGVSSATTNTSEYDVMPGLDSPTRHIHAQLLPGE